MTIGSGEVEEVLRSMIASHMEDQPWDVVCSDCGKGLEYSTRIDGDYDLYLTVEPCGCREPEVDDAGHLD